MFPPLILAKIGGVDSRSAMSDSDNGSKFQRSGLTDFLFQEKPPSAHAALDRLVAVTIAPFISLPVIIVGNDERHAFT